MAHLRLPTILMGLAAAGLTTATVWTGVLPYLRGPRSPAVRTTRLPRAEEYERWARAEFFRRHLAAQPLNWRLAEAALALHRRRPMGQFVLAVKPGEWGNDCSDFVDCVIDEALGARARCFRGSRDHLIGLDARYFACHVWDSRSPVQPGDAVLVRHSPWYDPDPEAAWHIGIVGSDGLVYDFAKLRSWSQPRYGRNSFTWFVRFSPEPGGVLIGRLRPQYRYLLAPIPVPASPGSSS